MHLLLKNLLLLIVTCFSCFCFGQNTLANKQLYQCKINTFKKYNDPRELYQYKKKGVANKMLNFYQKYITEHISGDCIFHPSCSRYCRASIDKQGFILGVLDTADRLIRCSEFSAKDIPYFKFDELGYVTEKVE